jgi:hypothetical protein
MLPRSVRPLRALGHRHGSTKALDRLLLDIHAAAKRDERGADPEAAEAVKRSSVARRGLAPRGDVALPRELVKAVDAVIKGEFAVPHQKTWTKLTWSSVQPPATRRRTFVTVLSNCTTA